MEETSAEEAASGHSKGHQHGDLVCAVYRAKIGGVRRNVTITWSRNAGSHTLSVSVDKSNSDATLACKVDLKPWPFWGKLKGSKSLDVDAKRVEVFWNLRSAKFSEGPEPSESYFIAVVADAEVVLLVGDRERKAYKKTRARPPAEDAELVFRRVIVLGKKCFNARTTLDDGKEHDVSVVNAISGHKDPEMWIRIDGAVLIHVTNLRWKFRGNESVRVEKVPVQVLWDVHDWLYRDHGTGNAVFIFKTGSPAVAASMVEEEDGGGESGSSDAAVNDEGSSGGSLASSSGGGGAGVGVGAEGSGDGAHEFCFFLHARKTDGQSHHQ